MNRLIASLIFLFIITGLSAQHHDHQHGSIHLGIGAGATYLFAEEAVMPGLHFHAMKSLGHGKFSAGLGFESLLDEHSHYSFSLLAGYSPLEKLVLKAGPGLTLSKHEGHWEQGVSAHFECIYEFNLRYFHIGPMICLGIDRHETHATLGLHLGIGLHKK